MHALEVFIIYSKDTKDTTERLRKPSRMSKLGRGSTRARAESAVIDAATRHDCNGRVLHIGTG
eukprot:5829236-Karenia_brevis.AAC.1